MESVLERQLRERGEMEEEEESAAVEVWGRLKG
jgi:hypothetical protein